MLQFGHNFRRDFDGKEHISFSLVKIRFDHKFGKAYTGVDPKDKIFGDDCGFDEFFDFTTERKRIRK